MPVDPHTWSDITDFWTPTIVNGDLYRYSGQEFVPTGIQFHARRPIYKAYMAGNPAAIAAGAEGNVFATFNLGNISNQDADTGALFGAYMDPFTSGNFRLLLAAGGGLPGSPGGLGLATGYTTWPPSSSGANVSAGFGDSAGSSSSVNGTFQGLNSNASNTTAFVIDVLDLAARRWGLFGFNGTAGTLNMAPGNPDGSGNVSRNHAHWVSVYPSNGFTAAVPAPVQAWSDTSTLTAALLNGNTGIRDVLRYLNMPPALRAASGGLQPLSANTDTVINAMSAAYDTYGGFASNTYTVPRTGLYFVHGIVTTQNFSGELNCGVQINGTNYYGPRANMPGSSYGSATKTQIFSLNAGDTIKLLANASASATTSSTHSPRLIVLNVGCLGAPAVLPIPPDTTFRWTAGTPGSLSQLFNNHVANDLLFLTQRPYLMSYQSTARDAVSMNSPTPTTMDAITGLIHGDDGDNFNGWNGSSYTAQVAGWYMAVQETFLAAPSVTSSPWVGAAFQVGPHPGAQTWDQFQKWNMSTSSGHYPGATAVSYYYLRPGDTLRPGVITANSSNTTINTVSETARRSHFELVYLGE